ncbi:MAG: hypothetical protein ABR552_03840 [Actinomycetota bacterium]|nr:hypothetical protein [Actinomycetota bacterium]
MPAVQISRAPSRAQYEQVGKQVDVAGDPPAGLILHAAVELPSGEVEIVDVFETAEALAAFAAARVVPALQRTLSQEELAAHPRPTAYDAFEYVAGGAR